MKKILPLIILALFYSGCVNNLNNNTDAGGNKTQKNLFFEAAKNSAPVFQDGSSKASKADWNWGGPVFELYSTFKDYDPATDSGTNKTGLDNIYKFLYQAGSFYNECMNYGVSTGDIKLISPYNFGRTDNTYNKILNRESPGQADYFAVKKDGTVNYCLLSWYREYSSNQRERGIMQGYFDEGTGIINIDLVCYVEYTDSTYSQRTHLEGNTNTHRFTKLLSGKWNGGTASYRAWFAGSGISRGTGNTFLFKIRDNNSLSTDKYFDFPSDADITALKAMSDGGSAATSSPYKADVDAMVSGGEYFDIITASPAETEIASSSAHFHGTGMGNMKPVSDTDLEGVWYGKTWHMTITGNDCLLGNNADTMFFTGTIALNTNTLPKIMDFTVTNSSNTTYIGKTILGIFQLSNGILLYKANQPGDLPRPADFSMTNGSIFAFSRDTNNLPDVPGGYSNFTFMPLEFHYANPGDIDYAAAFATPDWSGPGKPHNGIDLKIKTNLIKSEIISPTYGTVKEISWNMTGSLSTPPDLIMVHVNIYINSSYSVSLVFEPGALSNFISNQINAITVSPGQIVHPGDVIGDLLVGPYGYPHIHIMLMKDDEGKCLCPYHNSSAAAKAIYDNIIALHGTNLSNSNICCAEWISNYY